MSVKSIVSDRGVFFPLLDRLRRSLSTSRQGMKDTVVSAVPQIVGVFTGFFGSVLVARGLGPDGMGQYALVMSLAGIAASLSDLGVGQTAIRYASRAAANKDTPTQMAVLRWAFRWRLSLVFISTTGFFLLVPCIAKLWHSEALIPYMRLGLMGGVFAALASVPTIYFQSIKRFSTNASVTSAQRIISFAGILVLSVFSLWSLRNLVLANLVASAIGTFVFVAIVPRAAIWPQNAIDTLKGLNFRRFLASPKMPHGANRELDGSSPAEFARFHMLAVIICLVATRADVWMMGYFLDKSDLGIYNVATKITLPLTIVLGAMNTALWPRASAITDKIVLLSSMRKVLTLCCMASLPVLFYALLAPLFVPWVFGEEYADASLIAQVLCVRFFISVLLSPVMIFTYSFGFVRYNWIVNAIQLFSIVLINLLLLPKIGALAPAIAILASTGIGLLLFGGMIAFKTMQLRKTI